MDQYSDISYEKLLAGDRRCLSKTLTLLESTHPQHREQFTQILDAIMPFTGRSIRIGISGSPGVGKSSFSEALALEAINNNKKVAILTVDPSSPYNGGSILGDKHRMSTLAYHPSAFIRPSPTKGYLGGVAEHTRESILVCEAAGYDTIIIETVGVGQSEFEVSDMVDFFLLLLLPNSGDYIQGIKRGILELVDGIVIHKADGNNLKYAQQTKEFYAQSMKIFHKESDWPVQVLCCSTKENKNIDQCWDMINNFHHTMIDNNLLYKKRNRQTKGWIEHLLMQKIVSHVKKDHPWFHHALSLLDVQLEKRSLTPNTLVDQLFSEYLDQQDNKHL